MPGGKLAGTIWLEYEGTIRAWDSEDISFVRAVAGMLALRLSGAGVRGEVADQDKQDKMTDGLNERSSVTESASTLSTVDKTDPDEAVMPEHTGALKRGSDQKINFSERLRRRGFSNGSIKADIYDNINVLVLQFTDPFALAEYFGGENPTTAVDHLICHFEDLFDAHRVDYWKIISDQLVCATGMEDASDRHVQDIADLALNFQDKCSHLFANIDKPMEFKIGIDRGGGIGSPVGRRQRSYNLWGEAVSTASMMADNGVSGAIQVSETAYRCLQQNYLFRVRGRFYMQNVGEISTYLLTGRI
jgi:hypothetical protein